MNYIGLLNDMYGIKYLWKSKNKLTSISGDVVFEPGMNTEHTLFDAENRARGLHFTEFGVPNHWFTPHYNLVIYHVRAKHYHAHVNSLGITSFKTHNLELLDELNENEYLLCDVAAAMMRFPHLGVLSHPLAEERWLIAIRHNIKVFKYIPSPSFALCKCAIDVDANVAMQNITNVDAQMYAMGVNGMTIRFVNKPSEEMQLRAVKNRHCAIGHITKPSEAVCRAAIANSPSAFGDISCNLQWWNGLAHEVLEADPRNIKYFHTHSADSWFIMAIEKCPEVIDYFRSTRPPSKKLQLIAVQKSADAIKYIKEPHVDVQLEAVKTDPFLISHILNPCIAAMKEAVTRDPQTILKFRIMPPICICAIVYENNPEIIEKLSWKYPHIGAAFNIEINNNEDLTNEEELLQMINFDWMSLKRMQNPPKSVQLQAVQIDRRAIVWIRNPSIEVVRAAGGMVKNYASPY